MGKLLVNERDIVVPGQKLATGMDYLPASGAYRDGEDVVAFVLGLLTVNGRILKVIPLRGRYYPKAGDIVIGKIVEVTNSIWFVDIGYPKHGVLAMRDIPEYVEVGDDLTQYYNFGEYIIAKVTHAARGNFNLGLKGPGLRKVDDGKIIHVDSAKVPRIIGKQGSMISLIKEKTGCRIVVGQNGVVWIQGPPANEFVATEIMQLVNKEGHLEGLTEKVSQLLNDRMKDIVPTPVDQVAQESEETPSRESSQERERQPERRRNYRGGYHGREKR